MSTTYQAIIFDFYGVIYTGQAGAVIDVELLAYIQQLKQHYKLAVCSNISARGLAELLDAHNLTSTFDVTVTSDAVGVSKPNAEIFRYTLRTLGVDAVNAIFVDDQMKNVQGAQALGITGVWYQNRLTFQAELDRLLT